MKPMREAVGWCTPGDVRKIARLASQVILNRAVPGERGRVRLRLPVIRAVSGRAFR